MVTSCRENSAAARDAIIESPPKHRGEGMDQRVAFVTGASRGIGRAIALTLARAGYQVVAAATSIESNEEFGAELRAAGGQPLMVNLDVSSPESVKAAFTRAAAEKSRIDIL